MGVATLLSPAAVAAQPAGTPVQILATNDFHGNLDPLPGASGAVTAVDESGNETSVQAGGIARMATLLKQNRADHGLDSPSYTTGAGDMIGGSPLVSAAYHDEPAIHALEAMGLDVSSVGNHEFDEGAEEILRIANGGCHPKDGCAEEGTVYPGAGFPYLAANIVSEETGRPVLPATWIGTKGGVPIGFIGLATREIPAVVVAAGIKGLQFRDEVTTINEYAEALDRKGVKSIVVLIHEGGARASNVYNYDCDADGPGSGLSGPIKTIAQKTTELVDLIVSGHSHEPYVCNVPDPEGRRRLVTQAASFGRTFTDIRFEVSATTRDVIRDSVKAQNKIVTLDTAEDPAVKDVVSTWRERSAEVADRVVGHISEDILGRGLKGKQPETPLGDLITDAQVEITRRSGATLAFLNIGGMRADLVYAQTGQEGAGVVTYGEAFSVQPFDNVLVTMDLTGAQLLNVLREQFSGKNEAEFHLLQLSDGMRYSVDLTRQGAGRLLQDSVRVFGEKLRLDRVYRVTANSFLADGGNNFPTFREGASRVTGSTDLIALVEYLKAHTSSDRPLAATAANRVAFVAATEAR